MQKKLFESIESINARPFLKWAGGKSQLIAEIEKRLPEEIKKSKVIPVYVEPFIGGGAIFFYLKSHYNIKESYLFDINKELVLAYKVIQNNYIELIEELKTLEKEYYNKDDDQKSDMFYDIRDKYNSNIASFDYENENEEWVKKVAYLIFLNKTCFNGLYRKNSKGELNVPYGKNKKPAICDEKNIIEVNKALKNAHISSGDFYSSKEYITKDTLVYLDPPYRPISTTSSFNRYSKDGFTDEDQKRLKEFFKEMDDRGAYLILSNSDPKNINPKDNFFDDLYSGYNIYRVPAKRYINCDGKNRGNINELIITNIR